MLRRCLALLTAFLMFSTPTPISASSFPTDSKQGKPSASNRECRPGTGRVIGNVLGAIGGALLGRAIDGGQNRVVGTVVGGLVGTLIGGELGDALDSCEQQRVQSATIEAANSTEGGDGATREWRSESRPDVYGTVAAGDRVARRDGRECRTITRVSYIEGEERRGSSEVCRRPPDTAWA